MQQNNYRKLCGICLAVILMLLSGTGTASAQSPAQIPIGEDGSLAEEFSSHLPLLVLRMSDDNIETDGGNVMISLYHGEMNSPFVIADQNYEASLQVVKSFYPAVREKPDYQISLGESESLLEMQESSDWILSGSMLDKSLIRNYLAYTLARQAGIPAPQVQFCELIIEQGQEMKYMGVYLLAGNNGRAEMAGSSDKAILQRYLYRPESDLLLTAGLQKKYPPGYFALPYGRISDGQLQDITVLVDRIEETLYTTNHLEFLNYTKYIDENSFADYFLINEFMGNYSEGYQAMYTYTGTGGMLQAGPLGSFETAVDNEAFRPSDIWNIQFHETPWFDRISYSYRFWEKVNNRYHKLRETVLSERNVDNIIDEAITLLGVAAERDWHRWNHIYQSDKFAMADYTGRTVISEEEAAKIPYYDPQRDSKPRIRQAETLQQEIIRLKYFLHEHGGYLNSAFPEMMKQKGLVQPADDYVMNSWVFLGFIVLLSGSILFARWRNQ